LWPITPMGWFYPSAALALGGAFLVGGLLARLLAVIT